MDRSAFPSEIRRWRRLRRLSQLALAAEAGVSARHLAFLETGRARPSRAMVLRLAAALDLPPGAVNTCLLAAGFAPQFQDLPLSAPALSRVRQAMEWTMSRHAPWPALILDRTWTVVALNQPARRVFSRFGVTEGFAMLEALAALPDPALAFANWPEVGRVLLARLRAANTRAGGMPVLERAIAALARDPRLAPGPEVPPADPVIPAIWRLEDRNLAFFSTFAEFGAAADAGVAGLSIELMFPADDACASWLQALAARPD